MDRLEHRLLGQVARASEEFELLEAGDKVMVCMSGGKDSYVLLHLLRRIQARAPFRFDLIAVHLDQHQPGFDSGVVRRFLEEQGVEHRIVSEDTYRIVVDKTPVGKAYCSMCSRLRRGILYNTAVELGCTKIALGHHRDDSIETLMLNLLYSGQIKAMPARLVSDDRRNVVIRPLIHCAEKEIAELATSLAFPIQPCTVCSRQPDLKRTRVKALLDQLEGETPHLRANVYAALSNVRPSHLLDPKLRAAVGDAAPDEDDAVVALGAALESGCGA